MLSVAAFVIAARVVLMPVGDDSTARAAAAAVREAVVSVGHEPVDDEETTAALALVDDAACARGEVRCLTRLAVVAEARAAIAVLVSDGPRREAVVVSAAGERRRVQSVPASLTAAIARALVPPSTAQLRVSVLPPPPSSSSSSSSSSSPSPSSASQAEVRIDGASSLAVPSGDGTVLAVGPGEHRLVVRSPGALEQVLVLQIEAGESLWLEVVGQPVPVAPDRTRTIIAAVAGGAVGIAAALASAVLVTTARERVADAEAATFQSDRVAAAQQANLALGGAVASAVAGVVGMGAAILWGWP